MAFKDVRAFIEAIERTGDLVRIRQEVSWDLEVGAISRRAYEMGGPAVLFEKISDYPEGYRIFNGSLGTFRRLAIAMGLDPSTSVRGIQAEYERRVQHPIKPIVVSDAPCKENVMLGNEVDLYRFPAPMIHEGDGGRYIGTWDIVVSKDPDSGWSNWGMYRFMIHNQRALVGDAVPISHLGVMLLEKYAPKKQPMPVAIVSGADPVCHWTAATSYKMGESEVDFAGALRQEPVELVKCETSNLLVPANSEIVIEGEILPDATALESPFGEYPGYRSPGIKAGVACRVKAITYRNSPILTMICLGLPIDDEHIMGAVGGALAVKRRLLRHGIPVIDVHIPPESAGNMVIVSVKSGGEAVARQIRDVLTSRRLLMDKMVVVDEDVDVFNLAQVLHAFTVKCHPTRGIITSCDEGRGARVKSFYSPEERAMFPLPPLVAVLLDCTFPLEWSRFSETPVKVSFNEIYPNELRDKVIRNWADYGFK